MESANGGLTHVPPPTWQYYSGAAATAAFDSNLSNTIGPSAVDLYMEDPGRDNVGERRLMLNPLLKVSGTGDVPGDGSHAAVNAFSVSG